MCLEWPATRPCSVLYELIRPIKFNQLRDHVTPPPLLDAPVLQYPANVVKNYMSKLILILLKSWVTTSRHVSSYRGRLPLNHDADQLRVTWQSDNEVDLC
jgi:hypothetical protein